MDAKKITVKTYPFKKTPPRKKDGLHQIKLRVFVGEQLGGRFDKKKVIEIPLLHDDQSSILLSSNDFSNINSNKELKYKILTVERKVKTAVHQMIYKKVTLNATNIFNHTYNLNIKRSTQKTKKEDTIWNKDVEKFFENPIPANVWEEFQNYTTNECDNTITEEELRSIAASFEFEFSRDKDIRKVESMDYNQRYENGHYNKDNIFEVFGFCWTTNKKNNDPHIASSYKSLIVRLNDYRFNATPTENIKKFDDKWIDNFLSYFVKYGYSDIKLRNYDPFTIKKYRDKFISIEKTPYRVNSFKKLVKHFKKYIDILQTHNLITYNKSSRLINPNDYLSRDTIIELHTRREHSLTLEEFNKLVDRDFKNDRLNLAHDMFIISVLGGGFRTTELYDDDLYVQNNRLHLYRKKTKKLSVNPVFGQLKEVISRHNGIPEFLEVDEYRKALKEIAIILDFNRTIRVPDTTINSKNRTLTLIVKEIFSPYFARKTCATVLSKMGLIQEEVMAFMTLSKTDTYKFYKGDMHIDDKEKLIKDKLAKFNTND